jgi:hypothetical protein
MSRPPAPIFLERRTYRRRRLIDAARLLPIAGLLLFLVPLMWANGPGASTARGLIYLFLIWASLILVAAWMARYLARPETEDRPGEPKG